MLQYESLNRWYTLSFDGAGKRPAIIIGVYKPNLPILQKLLEGKNNFRDAGWKLDLSKSFGPHGAMKRCRGRGQYAYFRCVLSKKDREEAAEAIGGMLVLLSTLGFDMLLDKKLDVQWDKWRKQMVQVDPSLCFGNVSAAFTDWMDRRAKRKFSMSKVTDAMAKAWNACAEFKVKYNDAAGGPMGIRFLYMEDNGGFVLQTVGNACDVSTDNWWNRRKGEGHRLVPHNVDSTQQRLSLLAGLAMLDEMARKTLD